MNFPSHLRYTSDHEWLHLEQKHASIGITEHAIEQLGDIVHIDLPKVGQEFEAGDAFGSVESTKTVSDLYMPVAGKVIEVNSALLGELETLSEDAYDGGWLVRIEVESANAVKELMSAQDYENFIKEQDE